MDSFVSLRGPLGGDEAVTRALTFTDHVLDLDLATSAPDGIRVVLQGDCGQPLPDFALDDCPEVIGDEMERTVRCGNR